VEHWDVFLSDTSEVRRKLSTQEVRDALARGLFRAGDLIRPSGTAEHWASIVERFPLASGPKPENAVEWAEDDEEDDDSPKSPIVPPKVQKPVVPKGPPLALVDDVSGETSAPAASAKQPPQPPAREARKPQTVKPEAEPSAEIIAANGDSAEALPVDRFENADKNLGRDDLRPGFQPTQAVDAEQVAPEWSDSQGRELAQMKIEPLEEDEEAAGFTFSRKSADKIEELDLAAMVDVAFQLVLFFLVTASTVVFKTLEVPKPNQDSPAAGATQGSSKTLDDLQRDYILVDMDAAGNLQIDHEPVKSDYASVVEKLRTARETTGRKSIFLSADYWTLHENSIMVSDAAAGIGLEIASSKPSRDASSPPKIQ
jgi:biopolymer transport protein ExbD